MGAWGIGHFDNDEAGDWAWELEEAKSPAPVIMAFDEIDACSDYLDAGAGCIGLAAAEAVAASIGKPAADLPDDVARSVSAWPAPADPGLVARARSVVDKILAADSELRQLWEETNEFDAWQSKVADLRSRL